MVDKRCGTCRWWKLAAGGESSGFCFRPVPEYLPDNIWLQYHGRERGQGTTCKLWEARDEV